ncbi:MAG: hypothetical protein IIA12_05495 [Proteobacteria bacterium]|nr:hypothetical protein [Pseudomonadota bacterium]
MTTQAETSTGNLKTAIRHAMDLLSAGESGLRSGGGATVAVGTGALFLNYTAVKSGLIAADHC